MTLFEYLAIAVSLVLSFTVMRVVEGLAHVLESGRRWWVHAFFTLYALFSTLTSFWVFWSYRNVEWNFLRFLLLLGPPIALYYIACTLVPRDSEAVESWRVYFAEVAPSFFRGWIAWAVLVLGNQNSLGFGWMDPVRVFPVALVILSIVGMTTRSEKLWAAMSVLLMAGAPFFIWKILQPSPLAP